MFRVAVKSVCSAPLKRSFSAGVSVRKDLIQDLYLKELKAFKPKPEDPSLAASIKTFTLPPTPSAPSEVGDLSAALADYDASEVHLAPSQASSDAVVAAAPQLDAHGHPIVEEGWLEEMENYKFTYDQKGWGDVHH